MTTIVLLFITKTTAKATPNPPTAIMDTWTASLLALSALANVQNAQSFAFQSVTPSSSVRHTWPSLRAPVRASSFDRTFSLQYQEYASNIAQSLPVRIPYFSSTQNTNDFFPKTSSLDQVEFSFLPTEDDIVNAKFPLVVTPKEDPSLEFLSRFLETNNILLEDQMNKFGAVLFRGFEIENAMDVEGAIRSFDPNLNNNYRGTSPRNAQDGSDFVFSAAEVPSHYPIAQHLEMSFLPAPPKRLFFSALQAPTAIGGETAMSDFRQVYQDLPKYLRYKLHEKKLLYVRTHQKVGAKPRFNSDIASMLSWPDVFGTSDKKEVEIISQKENLPIRWTGKNQDTFVSAYVSEPFQLHPQSQHPVWFNHAQVFHWTRFPAELFLAFRRTRDVRYLVRGILQAAKSYVVYGLLRKKMALDIAFGDGTPISILEMHQIRKAIRKNMVFNRWQKGDLVMIDNFSISHGRQPTYDSGRKIVVAWSDPVEKTNDVIIPKKY
jgi:hypothetical protein